MVAEPGYSEDRLLKFTEFVFLKTHRMHVLSDSLTVARFRQDVASVRSRPDLPNNQLVLRNALLKPQVADLHVPLLS